MTFDQKHKGGEQSLPFVMYLDECVRTLGYVAPDKRQHREDFCLVMEKGVLMSKLKPVLKRSAPNSLQSLLQQSDNKCDTPLIRS